MPNTVLVLDEDTSIRTINTVADNVRSLLVPGACVQLDISSLSAPDLSVAQLICAARHHAKMAGAELSLTGPASSAMVDVLRRAGILTNLSDTDGAFWLQGDSTQ